MLEELAPKQSAFVAERTKMLLGSGAVSTLPLKWVYRGRKATLLWASMWIFCVFDDTQEWVMELSMILFRNKSSPIVGEDGEGYGETNLGKRQASVCQGWSK